MAVLSVGVNKQYATVAAARAAARPGDTLDVAPDPLAALPLLRPTVAASPAPAGLPVVAAAARPIAAPRPVAAAAALTPAATASAAPAPVATMAAPAPLAGTAAPTEYGRTGAVVPSGTVLAVGPNGAYASFAAALAAAHDGDTINLPAGTYPISPTTIAHRLIIAGVGGLAHFTAASASGDLFVTTADATFRNVEISGASIPAGVAAAIHDKGGNFTLVNSYLHDNQAGVIADPAPATSVGIYDTEIARNGTPDGRGAGVDAGGTGLLTLRNDWVHDGVAGPELRSTALATVIDATRISQAAGNGAADIALPATGRVSITNSALEKGASSLPTPLIDVGGQPALANSAVTITGTTLISDLASAPTRFVVAEPGAGPVSISGSTFVGGTAGSTQSVGTTNTGAQTASGLAINPVPPWTATPAASAQAAPAQSPLTIATAPPTTTQGYLVLRLSEDAYNGDAQFNLFVDGVQTADVLTATASHAAGESQTFTVAGGFTDGPHTVQLKFLNSLQGNTPGQSRRLYLDGMALNGDNRHQTATLTANGTATLTTGTVTNKTAITATVSEDAYKGDAQAFIAIDGAIIGGLQTVTAAHATGATQGLRFLLDLAPGAHTMALTYLNDTHGAGPGMDRNLYLNALDVAGTRVAGSAASLMTNSTKTIAFNVAPPPAANGSLFVTAGSPQQVALLPTLG